MPLDRFSTQAAAYARYRIAYPPELYAWLLPLVPHRLRAWDCATGNGQVAAVLADYFRDVEATDLSASQLAEAVERPNIHYQVARAEQTPFPDDYFDLITVGQAVHWFDLEAYHREVRRVAGPGTVLAEWGYQFCHTGQPALNQVLNRFHNETSAPYWDANRRHVENEYAQLPFPFARVSAGALHGDQALATGRHAGLPALVVGHGQLRPAAWRSRYGGAGRRRADAAVGGRDAGGNFSRICTGRDGVASAA